MHQIHRYCYTVVYTVFYWLHVNTDS